MRNRADNRICVFQGPIFDDEIDLWSDDDMQADQTDFFSVRGSVHVLALASVVRNGGHRLPDGFELDRAERKRRPLLTLDGCRNSLPETEIALHDEVEREQDEEEQPPIGGSRLPCGRPRC